MRHNRFLKIIADTGFGFSLVSLVFYSVTNVVGFLAMLTALTLITMTKLCPNSPYRWMKDPRTPMRISGIGLLLTSLSIGLQSVIGTAEASSLPGAQDSLWIHTNLALFFSTLLFGTANILQATLLETPDKIPKLSKNPEVYIFMGYIAASFYAGPFSAYALPLVTLAFAITYFNCRKKNPVYRGHPMVIYALAELGFAVAAAMEQNYVPCLARLLCAAYLMRVDALLTPGGLQTTFAAVRLRR